MQTSFAVRPARVDRALTPTLRVGPFAYQDVAVLGDVAACPQRSEDSRTMRPKRPFLLMRNYQFRGWGKNWERFREEPGKIEGRFR